MWPLRQGVLVCTLLVGEARVFATTEKLEGLQDTFEFDPWTFPVKFSNLGRQEIGLLGAG